MGWPHDLDIDGRFLCHQMWSFMGLARNYSNPDNPCIYSAFPCISKQHGLFMVPLETKYRGPIEFFQGPAYWPLWQKLGLPPLSWEPYKGWTWLPSLKKFAPVAQVVRAFPPAWYGHLQRLRRSFVRSDRWGRVRGMDFLWMKVKVISLKGSNYSVLTWPGPPYQIPGSWGSGKWDPLFQANL